MKLRGAFALAVFSAVGAQVSTGRAHVVHSTQVLLSVAYRLSIAAIMLLLSENAMQSNFPIQLSRQDSLVHNSRDPWYTICLCSEPHQLVACSALF